MKGICNKAPNLYEKFLSFAYDCIEEELVELDFEENEIMDTVKEFEVSNDFISDVLSSVSE